MEPEKWVTVMIGEYPRRYPLSKVPLVKETAQRAKEFLISKGVPKEKAEAMYTVTIKEESR